MTLPKQDDDIAEAMARIRATLEERAKESPVPLASYDTKALGRILRPKLDGDGRGWNACAREIGVTMPDLSRICAGQTVSAAKVFAVSDWLGVDARDFFRPVKHKCFTGKALKQRGRP